MHIDPDRTHRRDPVAGQAEPMPMTAGGGVRAGPKAERAAPSGAGLQALRDRARPQPRSASAGRCGVSPLEGVAGDGLAAPA